MKTSLIVPSEAAIAAMLLSTGAVQLRPQQPFTWASGRLSPIYCDNRLTLGFPDVRTKICDALAEAVSLHFPAAEAIAGVATAGIPQGALLADRLGLPFNYVRSAPKSHGMENLIEGRIVPGQKVVVIEDLISTGGSSLKAVEALRKAGFEVLGMAAVFTYGFPEADRNFAEAETKLVTLSNFEALAEVAVSGGYIPESSIAQLKEWKAQFS
ncbi:MAG: orotate phosphoribosyltransferase [Bacteroidota bacterium]